MEKIGDTKLSPDDVIVLPKSVLNLFITEGKLENLKEKHKITASDMISSYSLFLSKAREQHTNQVYATTWYVHNVLGISMEKVRKTKDRLRELGLIKDVELRTKGKFTRWLLRLPYVMKRYNREDAIRKSLILNKKKKKQKEMDLAIAEKEGGFNPSNLYNKVLEEIKSAEKLNIRLRKVIREIKESPPEIVMQFYLVSNLYNSLSSSLMFLKLALDLYSSYHIKNRNKFKELGEIDENNVMNYFQNLYTEDMDLTTIKKMLIDSFKMCKHLRKAIILEIESIEKTFQRPTREDGKNASKGEGVTEDRNLPKRDEVFSVEKEIPVTAIKDSVNLKLKGSEDYYSNYMKEQILGYDEEEDEGEEYVYEDEQYEDEDIEPIILWEGMPLEEKREVVRRAYTMRNPKVYTIEEIKRMDYNQRKKLENKLREVEKKRNEWLKEMKRKKGELDWEDKTVKQVADIVIEGINLGGFSNRIPKNLDKATKGFKTAVKRLYYLLKGVKEEFDPDLDEKWLKDWELNGKDLFGNKYSVDELRSIVKKACIRFNRMRGKDYLPSNKNLLTKDINEFIYSTQFKRSWLMYCYFRRPIKVRDKIAEKIKNSIPPKFSEKIEKKYKKTYDPINYWNNMKNVYLWWKKNMETLYWQHFDIGDFYTNWRPFKSFLDRIVEWSEDTGMEYLYINPESGGKSWNKFCEWAYTKYGVNLIPDEDVAKLNKQYVEYEKEKEEKGRSEEEDLDTIEMFTESDMDFSILENKIPSFKALQRALGEKLINKELFIYLADKFYPYWYEELGYNKEDIGKILERIEKKKYMEDI